MIRTLTPVEVKKMHKEMVAWFEKELERDYGSFLYNLALEIQHHIEAVRREKGIDICTFCRQEFTNKVEYREHLGKELNK